MSENDGKKFFGLCGFFLGNVKQSFSYGCIKNVVVEIKCKCVVVLKFGVLKGGGFGLVGGDLLCCLVGILDVELECWMKVLVLVKVCEIEEVVKCEVEEKVCEVECECCCVEVEVKECEECECEEVLCVKQEEEECQCKEVVEKVKCEVEEKVVVVCVKKVDLCGGVGVKKFVDVVVVLNLVDVCQFGVCFVGGICCVFDCECDNCNDKNKKGGNCGGVNDGCCLGKLLLNDVLFGGDGCQCLMVFMCCKQE